jgi:hypothetical protein
LEVGGFTLQAFSAYRSMPSRFRDVVKLMFLLLQQIAQPTVPSITAPN